MKKMLPIFLLAAGSLLVSQMAQAAYICGNDVNVRDRYGNVFSSAYYGETVTRTYQTRYFYVDYQGYRAFTRVYFQQYPQGYGWVATEYVCGS